MHAAALRFDLHVPHSRSLKVKRAAIRPIVDGARHRFHCSVSETGYQDQWQRAEIAVALVAASDAHLHEQIDTVERFVRAAADVEVLEVEVVHFDSEGTLAFDSEGTQAFDSEGTQAFDSEGTHAFDSEGTHAFDAEGMLAL